jgi:signal transduction histidine kinase
MSHELRTPLNSLIGYVDLLGEGLAGPVTDKQRHMLSRVTESALHLLAVIEQILTFSRTEAGGMTVVAQPYEATALARETVSLFEPLLRKKNLEFELVLPDQPIEMESDPGLLKQILINLLMNAVKFTEAGRIRLEIKHDERDLTCAVHDSGIGIPPEDLERIFEPFQQVERDLAHRKEGTGLGLTVSRRLARLLGGDLTVQSRLGEGSTFTVRVPLRSPSEPEPAR